MKALNIHIACGGTGGHIFPGLATANVLRRRGHAVTLLLAGKDVERIAVAGWDGPVRVAISEGFASGAGWGAVRAAARMLRAISQSYAQMRQAPPDVLLGMGSYASVGPVTAALLLGRPVVLHEANAVPGRMVSLYARWAARVGVMFEETRFYLKRRAVVFTGMPLRPEAAAGAGEPRPESAAFTVLVMGGSRGARRLNELATEAAARLNGAARATRFIHLTGAADEERVRAAYAAAGVEHEVQAFCPEMGGVYHRADLAITRSGAATCAELLAHRLPALLVPYPYAARHHQHANARAMSRYGASDWVDERDLESAWLADYIDGMRRAPERRHRMSADAARYAQPAADVALADVVEEAAHASTPRT